MDDVEKIKQKLDIVEVIGEYITLKKTGRNFSGLCPLHNEKTPSFTLSPERQIWHCFGCGKGGDIFSFFMEYDKLEFSESLKLLADKAGITLTQSVFKSDQEQKKENIYELNRRASQFYTYLLLSHSAGKQALQYLTEKRGLSLALIKKFELGFAPRTPTILSNALLKKKYQTHQLIDAGLATERNGRLYDFFRNRIIFPITDVRGNIIAFSGRTLDNSLPKYINTRETLVYKKGDTAYGLYFAKDTIKKENKILIVEGEFDVISCFKEGITNAVAVKGTALTESQIKLFKRYAQKFLFCFDTDNAGSAAQRRSIEMIEKEGVNAAVIVPPEGKDPDELLKENPIAFKKALKEEIHIYDFIITSSTKNLDLNNVDAKKEVLAQTLPILSVIENEVIKEHYLKKLADILNTSLDALLRQANKNIKLTTTNKTLPPRQIKSREEIVEEYLLALILQAKDPIPALRSTQSIIQKISLITPSLQKIYERLTKASDSFNSTTFTKSLPPELTQAFDRCYLSPIPEFENEIEYLKEVEKKASEVRTLSIKNQLKYLGELIKEREKLGNEPEMESLRTKFGALTQLLQTK